MKCNDNCKYIHAFNSFELKMVLKILQFELFFHKCIQLVNKWQRIPIVIMYRLKTLVCDSMVIVMVIVILKNVQ